MNPPNSLISTTSERNLFNITEEKQGLKVQQGDGTGEGPHNDEGTVDANDKSANSSLRKLAEFADIRTLSLDGGGSRGIIMAMVIDELEKRLNSREFNGGQSRKEWSEDEVKQMTGNGQDLERFENMVKLWQLFDLIIGTSTGGLLAVALGVMHWTGYKCTEFYKKETKNMFQNRCGRLRYCFTGTKFNTSHFERIIDGIGIPKEHNKYTKSPIVGVTSYDIENRNVVIFSTNSEDDGPITFTPTDAETELKDTTMFDVLRATTAAPTFLKHITIDGRDFVDGGLGANCPAMKAFHLVDKYWNDRLFLGTPPFKSRCTKPRTCELLLSLGTGIPKPGKNANTGCCNGGCLRVSITWGIKLKNAVTHAESIYNEAWKHLKRLNRFAYHERLNPPKSVGFTKIELDDTDVAKMMSLTTAWLNTKKGSENSTKQNNAGQTESNKNNKDENEDMNAKLWRTTYKLVAKNYYVEVTTPENQNKDESVRKLTIQQRWTNLFKIEHTWFEVFQPDTGKFTSFEKNEETGEMYHYLKQEQARKLEEEVTVFVTMKPTDRKDGYEESEYKKRVKDNVIVAEERYLISGSPITITFRDEKQIEDKKRDLDAQMPKGTHVKALGSVVRAAAGIEQSDFYDESESEDHEGDEGSLTDQIIEKLSTVISSHDDLQILGILGLQKDEYAPYRHLGRSPGNYRDAAQEMLKEWRDAQKNAQDAYESLKEILKEK